MASVPALTAAIAALLEPIATLAVARGLPAAAVEELLRAAFVAAAQQAQPESAGPRIVSRVSAATGLSRRERFIAKGVAQARRFGNGRAVRCTRFNPSVRQHGRAARPAPQPAAS